MTRPEASSTRVGCAGSSRGRRSPAGHLLLLLVLWCALSAFNGCGETSQPVQVVKDTPEELKGGEATFNAHCAKCHGPRATGTDLGPPLVHKIYEPSHHGDAAFYRAAANGVRAHHWNFGNMPNVEGVSPEDVGHVVQYIRWLQRQAGIT